MVCLLVLPLLLLVCLPLPSSADTIPPYAATCHNVSIPQPFGLIGSYTVGPEPVPGFEIICGSSGPMLPINGTTYRVLDISLSNGSLRILGNTIAWECHNTYGSNQAVNNLNLERTRFVFSDTHNKFTAVGCDAMAMLLSGTGHGGNGAGSRYSGGCVSFCATNGSILDGTCSGVGCCQAPMPQGLKNLKLEFQSIRKISGSAKDGSGEPCSKAFIVDKDLYKFSHHDLQSDPRSESWPLVLEWSISDGCCEEVRNTTAYACMENSECYDAPNRIGYRCNCSQGYNGNPYLPPTHGGCTDINECMDKSSNPCTHKCINKIGGFNCKCPMGMAGDGKNGGSGCSGSLGLVLFLVILGFWTYWLMKKRKNTKQKQLYFLQNGGLLLQQQISAQRAPIRIFILNELKIATNNFSERHIIGRGRYGTVYKGLLSDETAVAIKKSKFVDESQMEQFINELTEIPLLVYEFISNGSLFHHLHNNKLTPISWERRLKIATETASALSYLHLATDVPIIHRDVKSANILLDEIYVAKVSDFGASSLLPCNQTHVTTLVQGTFGYLDPEYFQTSQLTDKSDVYSFGVVLVELITREKPITCHRPDEGRNLTSHFTTLAQENRILDIIDSTLVKEAGIRHVNAVAQLALKCLRLKGEDRPRMVEIAIELEALRRLMKQHLSLKCEKELRKLRRRQLVLDGNDSQFFSEENCQDQICADKMSNLGHNDIDMDEGMQSSP
uniref:Protein kinase domain-containing protein n=1 Tax=Leersia perrieri TaxID=77586 RepID=A0A0D9VJV3_9ORYZ